ncbi:MAG: hypothetical protein SRB1_00740 [Desulfobacteraceae bacterium Eth-SRB1]|nr:MAG: hypothetical protein SRB1_00740 [Desulfobacteraceae bacterium Eth-SRB1]
MTMDLWQRLHYSKKLAAVIEGVKFVDGIEENRNLHNTQRHISEIAGLGSL